MLYWDFIKYTPERNDAVENVDRMLTSSNSASRKRRQILQIAKWLHMNKRTENPILAAQWRFSFDTGIKQTFYVIFLQKCTRFQFMKRKKCFHRKDFGVVSPKRCVKWGANK